MHDRLGINQDLPFQQRAWRYQRLAWGMLGLTLIGALLGLFGQGPLADASMVDASGTVTLDYERLTRFDRLTYLTVSLSAAPTADALEILLDAPYAQAVVLHQSMPASARMEWTAEGVRFRFPRVLGKTMIVKLLLSVKSAGPVRGRIRVNQGDWLTFTQFVYP